MNLATAEFLAKVNKKFGCSIIIKNFCTPIRRSLPSRKAWISEGWTEFITKHHAITQLLGSI